MKNDAYQNATTKFLAAAFVAASTLLLSSCGGGGAATNPTIGGPLNILPSPIFAYAGVPITLTIAGGRPPYALGSSEPSIFPVPQILNGNSITILPDQPGVIDAGLTPQDVPRRSGVLSARDSNGLLATANFSVNQNFLLGYGVGYSNFCPVPTGGTGPNACVGSETVVTINPTTDGVRRGNALLRFERLRGDFAFTQCVSPPPVNPVLVNTITINTDHNGIGNACIRISNAAPTQFASYRVIDVATGVYSDEIFTISGTPSGVLTVIPPTVTLTGSGGRCGSGSSDIVVFDGTPPYTAISTNPTIVSVTPSTSPSNPGRFSITVFAQNPPCPAGNTVVVTDASGRRATVTVDSAVGGSVPALAVAPTSLTLSCGTSGSVTVIGGAGNYTATSSSANLTAGVSGNIVSISRALVDPGVNDPLTHTDSVTITDGATISTVTVTNPNNC